MRLHEQRWVDRPRDEVFAYTADFANIAQWDPGVVNSRRLDEGPVGVGSRFALEVRFGRSTTPMTYEITRYEPNRLVVLAGTGDKVDATDEIEFEDDDGGTRISYTAKLDIHGPLGWITPLLGPVLRRIGARAMDGLRETLHR